MRLRVRVAIGWASGILTGALMGVAWGSWRGFAAHPARIATAAIMAVYDGLAWQFTAGPARGIRHVPEGAWYHATLQVLGTALLLLPPFLEPRGVWLLPGGDGARYAGLLVLVAGALLRLGPMMALGRRFSHLVALQPEHRLEMGGLYARVRHPSYLGLILQFVGISLVFRSALALALDSAFVLLIVRRMNVEERFLVEQFGDEYRSYMRRTARLVPGVY